MAVSALLWILGGLLALVLLLLFLPLDLFLRLEPDLAAETYDDPLDGPVRWLMRLRWGRWLFSGEFAGEYLTVTKSEVRLLGLRLRSRSRSRPRKKPSAEKKPKKKRKRPSPELIVAYVEEGAQFLARVAKDLGLRVRGRATYGFADPALTGWCEGIRWAVAVPLPIELAPEFARPCLQGWAEVEGRTYGYRVARAIWKGMKNPVIARQIKFRPLRYFLLRGG